MKNILLLVVLVLFVKVCSAQEIKIEKVVVGKAATVPIITGSASLSHHVYTGVSDEEIQKVIEQLKKAKSPTIIPPSAAKNNPEWGLMQLFRHTSN